MAWVVFFLVALGWSGALSAAPLENDDDVSAWRETSLSAAAGLDWQQSAGDGNICLGGYVEPIFPDPASPDSASDQSAGGAIAISGERLERQGQNYCLSSAVYLRRMDSHLWSEEACYDAQSGVFSVPGDLVFRTPGVLIRGAKGQLARESGGVNLEEASFVLHKSDLSWHGTAESASYQEGSFRAQQVSVSSCPPGDASWNIWGGKVRVEIDTGRLDIRGAALRLGKVPIFYFPRLRLSTDSRKRQSGFLLPEIAVTHNGLELEIPYYFNLAPHQDLRLGARFMTDGGVLAKSLFRRLDRRMRNEISFIYSRYDEESGSRSPAALAGKQAPDDRWLAGWRHEGSWGESWTTRANYLWGSDKQIQRDLNSHPSRVNRTWIRNDFALGYKKGALDFGLSVIELLPLVEGLLRPYRLAPGARIDYQKDIRGFGIRLLGDFGRYDAESPSDSLEQLPEGNRFYAESRLTWEATRLHGHLRFDAAYRGRGYRLTSDLSRDQGAALVSADAGLVWQRSGKGILQTLEPRLQYLWSTAPKTEQEDLPLFDTVEPFFSYEDIFRESRFVGHDRLADANRIGLGLVSRILDSVSGRQRLMLRGSFQLTFAEPEVTLGNNPGFYRKGLSPFVFGADWRVTENLHLSGEWLRDFDEKRRRSFTVRMRYSDDQQRTFYADYRVNEQKSELEQARVAFYLPMGKLALSGSWRTDLVRSKRIGSHIGVEYNNCCWALRLYWHTYLRSSGVSEVSAELDDAILVQLTLRGLGDAGSSVDSMLRATVPGYRP